MSGVNEDYRQRFRLKKDDICQEVDGVISVGQFYEKAAGVQIIFT